LKQERGGRALYTEHVFAGRKRKKKKKEGPLFLNPDRKRGEERRDVLRKKKKKEDSTKSGKGGGKKRKTLRPFQALQGEKRVIVMKGERDNLPIKVEEHSCLRKRGVRKKRGLF